jgi:hypothetical protein
MVYDVPHAQEKQHSLERIPPLQDYLNPKYEYHCNSLKKNELGNIAAIIQNGSHIKLL